MRRRSLARWLSALAAAALLPAAAVACDDDDGGGSVGATATPATATTTSTATPSDGSVTATGTATTPAGTPTQVSVDGETGNEDIDELIAAVLDGDMGTLVERAQVVTLACTTSPGAGGPPQCAAGELPGAQVEVFPFATCQGEYVRQQDLNGVFARELEDVGAEIYAVFELEDEGTPQFPLGTHGILFETEGRGGSGPQGVLIGTNEDGDVISLYRGCQATAEQLYDERRDPDGEVLLEPATP